MSFTYKKVKYENIYEWAKNGPGTCFYCKEDKPVALNLLGEKGICHECLDAFEIGNLAVDRHVVMKIMPRFADHYEAKEWFSNFGELRLVDTVRNSELWYLYDFVTKEQLALPKPPVKEIAPGFIGYTPEAADYENNSKTRLEISESGSVHIVY